MGSVLENMPRGRDSRSPSRRCPPAHRSRKDSRSRSPPRRGRDSGRGGSRRDDNYGDDGSKSLKEWGDSGIIVQLKDQGIGFIRPHSGKVDDRDLFFHKSALVNVQFDDLQTDDEVTYEPVVDSMKGKAMASNIKLVNGKSKSRGGGRGGSRSASRGRRR